MALALLAMGAGNGHAATSAAATTHVYLLRGVLNIFSLGLDEIAAKLQHQGFNVTVANYLSWSSLADQAAAATRAATNKRVFHRSRRLGCLK